MDRGIYRLIVVVFTLLCSFFVFSQPVLANTITVTTFIDEINTNGNCSLREAIRAANLDAIVDNCTQGNGADSIVLSSGTYTLTIQGANEDFATTGDLDILANVNIIGTGSLSTTIIGGLIDRVFQITNTVTAEISDITIRNGGGVIVKDGGAIHNSGILTLARVSLIDNVAKDSGGGVFNANSLTIIKSTLTFNAAGSGTGGAIQNAFGATAIVSQTQLINNTAKNGGAIHNAGDANLKLDNANIKDNSASGQGAGIFAQTNGVVSIYNSTISTNTAVNEGAGIHNENATFFIVNSTISENKITGYLERGGGLYNTGIIQLTNSTIVSNSSSYEGGAWSNSGTIRMKNSIIASNTAQFRGQCDSVLPLSQGNNLATDDSCNLSEPSDRITTNPRLGPLQENGDSTPTHALLFGSPAINGASNVDCPITDQRGITRPKGTSCDIGAYEYDGIAPTTDWTAMIYLNGDNDLDGNTERMFNNLEKAVALNPTLRVIVLWDRLGLDNTTLYQILPDDKELHLAVYADGVNRWSMGELNMGDPATLVDFVNSARALFPANHYFLSIVNHGGGWSPNLTPAQAKSRWAYGGSGFSWDETNNFNYLSTADMKIIFSQIAANAGPIDVVFYDACLMAMFEEVYQIRDSVHYLVASENETWASYPYDLYLATIVSTTTPLSLATHIARQYTDSLIGYPRTMTVIDIQQAITVATALDNLSQSLIESLPSNKATISSTFLATQKFDYNFDLRINPSEGYVDLQDFAEGLIRYMPGTPVASAANALSTTLNGLVVFEASTSGVAWVSGEYLNLDRAHGISIYLPLGEKDSDRDYYTSSQLTLAADTRWDNFIFAFLGYSPQPGGSNGGRGEQPSPIALANRIFLPHVVR